jgi:hypothetical protein
MSHTYVNGFGGSVTFGSATLDVESWSLKVNADAVDTTNTGDAGWDSNILGSKNWEGSGKTFFDSAAVPTGTAGFTAGARATGTFPIGSTGKSYTGSIQLTSIGFDNPAKSVVGFTFDFKGTGPLTYAT